MATKKNNTKESKNPSTEKTIKGLIEENKLLKQNQEVTRNLYDELKKKNKELKKLDQLKTEFIATVSHELRTPLFITKEGISLVVEGITGKVNDEQKNILAVAKNNMDRLIRIINNLLDISKLEAGKVELKKEMINMSDLVRKIVSSFEAMVTGKGLELTVNLPEEEITVDVDQDKIMQVLTNLMGNALKFTEKGSMNISIVEKEDMVECMVTDTGRGIAAEDLPSVFDKFQQIGRIDGPGERGTGLGLSITKQIVELHGGGIGVESEPGKGSRFYFTVPKYMVSETVCTKLIWEHLQHIQGAEEKLSLICINITNRDDIRAVLGQTGCTKAIFTVANTAKMHITRPGDAIIVCRSGKIMCVLPHMDVNGATTVCRKIKEAVRSDKVVSGDTTMDMDTRFSISCFPRDGLNAEELMQAAEETLTRKKKVLIVDDHPQIVRFLTYRLKMENRFEYAQAFNGEEAIKSAFEDVPDLIILDIMMPKMNGYEVIGHLKENKKTRDVPIVILTAHNVEPEKIKGIFPGSIPVVTKTEGFEKLVEIVDTMI